MKKDKDNLNSTVPNTETPKQPTLKEILKADIGINPNNDGKVIRLSFPELNEDRRREIVKEVKKILNIENEIYKDDVEQLYGSNILKIPKLHKIYSRIIEKFFQLILKLSFSILEFDYVVVLDK